MIKSKVLVQEYRLQFAKTYKDMDCIKSIENIIARYGGKSSVVGSNWWARYEVKNMRPLTDRAQLYDGCAVLKTKWPGESGYALPSRYTSHAIKIDYNHIGIGTDRGEILDSTTIKSGVTYIRNGPGISTANIGANSWDIIADFIDVDYSDKTGSTLEEYPSDDVTIELTRYVAIALKTALNKVLG